MRVHPAPEASDYRGYLFRDFANGASRHPHCGAGRASRDHAAPLGCGRNPLLSRVRRTRKEARPQGPGSRILVSRPARNFDANSLRTDRGFRGLCGYSRIVAETLRIHRQEVRGDGTRRRPGETLARGPLPWAISARSDDGPRCRRGHARDSRKLVEDRRIAHCCSYRARHSDARNRTASRRAWCRDVPHQPFLSRWCQSLFHLYLPAQRSAAKSRNGARSRKQRRMPSSRRVEPSAIITASAKITCPGSPRKRAHSASPFYGRSRARWIRRAFSIPESLFLEPDDCHGFCSADRRWLQLPLAAGSASLLCLNISG